MSLRDKPLVALLWVVCLGGCSEPTGERGVAELVSPEARRLQGAAARALDWVETVNADPLRVRDELGMKGVKHFVEYLDLCYHVYRWNRASELGKRAQGLALSALRVVDKPEYHNLAEVDEKRFREDSMSYLRACHLAEEFGRDTALYRAEIDKVLPRIYGHLPTRGVDQRMGFALLFAQLGLRIPEPMETIFAESLIAQQVPLSYYLASPDRPYDITHEIFAMTARGRRPFPFRDRGDESYTKNTVRQLLKDSIQRNNLDIAAELLVNLADVGEKESILASQARAFLLKSQNSDGSFAKYDVARARAAKKNPRYDVQLGGNLHTTMVCIWALVDVTENE